MIFLQNPRRIKVGQGRTIVIEYPIRDENGEPHTFESNPKVIFALKRNADSDPSKPIFTISADPDIDNSSVTFKIYQNYTSGLETGSYFYDVALYEGSNNYRTVVKESIIDIYSANNEV